MNCIEGKVLTEQGFKKGYIRLKKQKNPTIHFGTPPKSSTYKKLIIPTFINAHTHIGDTFIREKNIPLPRNIEQLVAPPNGLKHNLLKNTNSQEILQGITHGLKELKNEGISTFIDFRENGIAGIHVLRKAQRNTHPQSIILARPDTNHPSTSEIHTLLNNADGIGISSIKDMKYDIIETLAEHTKKDRKIFALHASERIQEPIKPILKLHPDFIVHMTQASTNDLKQVKKQKIPIVVCPRSNLFFNMKPNLKKMKEVGNTILLGTDNFMFHPPSILKEIQCIKKWFPNLFTIEEIFKMPTYDARKALNLKDNIPGSTLPTSWIIINPENYQIETVIRKIKEGLYER